MVFAVGGRATNMDTGMESRPNRRRGGITLRTRPWAMLERCQSAGRFAEGMKLCWVVIGEGKWMVGERALAAFLNAHAQALSL
jgi:hypothetical protein